MRHRALHAFIAFAFASTALAQTRPTRTLVHVTTYTSMPIAGVADPSLVKRLRAPAGFAINVFARGLGSPRMIAVSGDGAIYVTRRDSNDVVLLRDDGTGRSVVPRVVARGLPGVHGIALRGTRMYLATVKEIFVAEMLADGSVSDPRPIVTDLPDGGQHPNRTIAFGPDGMLYVSVGSTCNLCLETNDENATLLRMKPDGSERGVFARGLRNTIGWGWHPQTQQLWGLDQGADEQGNAVPPEELNRIENGMNYGWPFCYADRIVDRFYAQDPPGSTKEQICARSTAPVLMYPAHASPTQMAFYTGTQFPPDYRGDAFVAMRGSWNRQPPAGYKLVRVRFQNGQPVAMDDFVIGFLSDDGNTQFGRLAGVAMTNDGALLLGDDANGVIYRITYPPPVTVVGAVTEIAAGEVALRPFIDTMPIAMPRDTVPLPPRPIARASRVAFIDGLRQPAAVIHDRAQDAYFISNMNGRPTEKDGRGFITRVDLEVKKTLRWIESGRRDVVLNAPKGMAIVGETLWVADIDHMRAFHRRTGAPMGSINLSSKGATFLNDVSVGGDGAMYVTDTEIAFDSLGNTSHPRVDRVFRIDRHREVTIALETDRLSRPGSIVWDAAESRFIITSFRGDSIWSWEPGVPGINAVVSGPGQFDGAVFTTDGLLLVASKATSSIYAVRDDRLQPVVQQLPDIAIIGIDRRRGLLLVPLTSENRVELYQSP